VLGDNEEAEEDRWSKGVTGLANKFAGAVEKFKKRVAAAS
jgi:hypothetical protein